MQSVKQSKCRLAQVVAEQSGATWESKVYACVCAMLCIEHGRQRVLRCARSVFKY